MVAKTLVETVFLDVFEGQLSTVEANEWIHRYCTTRGLNPTLTAPFTTLMMSEEGRSWVERYEEFFMQINWLFAKLAAHSITIDHALEQFFQGVDLVAMCRELPGNKPETALRGNEYGRFLQCQNCLVCPQCESQRKNFY